jgi:hypothetical protein
MLLLLDLPSTEQIPKGLRAGDEKICWLSGQVSVTRAPPGGITLQQTIQAQPGNEQEGQQHECEYNVKFHAPI